MRVLPFSLYNRGLIEEKFVILQSYSEKDLSQRCALHRFVRRVILQKHI